MILAANTRPEGLCTAEYRFEAGCRNVPLFSERSRTTDKKRRIPNQLSKPVFGHSTETKRSNFLPSKNADSGDWTPPWHAFPSSVQWPSAPSWMPVPGQSITTRRPPTWRFRFYVAWPLPFPALSGQAFFPTLLWLRKRANPTRAKAQRTFPHRVRLALASKREKSG